MAETNRKHDGIKQPQPPWLVPENLLLGLIMLTAGVLRFYHYGKLPFMHDEFSALFRTSYGSFSDLIKYGVIENDSHPAGVQVFLYYWVKLVGFNELWVKLPFTLMGVASVWLMFAIGRCWHNVASGLISASFLAVMQFFVFYSQLARPYAAGLFFSLCLVYCWTVVIDGNKSPSKITWLLFVLSLVLTSLMHAFAMLLAMSVYVTGFVFVRGRTLKTYLFSGGAAIVLYLPHLPVFLQQLQAGGIGDWLAPPTAGFVLQFLHYSLHFSKLFIVVALALVLVAFVSTWRTKKGIRFKLIGLGWFAVSFLAAYLYSIYRTPVIQFSTLYFVFPFLILALFSVGNTTTSRTALISVGAVLIIGSISLIINRKHYHTMYTQGFDGIAREVAKDSKAHKDVTVIVKCATPQMPAFYLDKQAVGMVRYFSRQDEPGKLQDCLDSIQTQYLAFAWTDYASEEWTAMALESFPVIERYEAWFNTEYFLLRKAQPGEETGNQTLIRREAFSRLIRQKGEAGQFTRTGLPYTPAGWCNEPVGLDSQRLYGPLFETPVHEIKPENEVIVCATASFLAIDTLSNLKLVMELKNPALESIKHWQAGSLLHTTKLPGRYFTLVTALRLGRDVKATGDDLLRAYAWDPDGKKCLLLNQSIITRPVNPILFGLFEPLP
ncbi:MAG: glycosyltransferase family 39 protein [Bacteroidetes bacterium]|nr:glycosyltransferase family 39 protein [Bacteroidota bacterium]